MFLNYKVIPSLVQVRAPVVDQWLVLRLYTQHLLQLSLNAAGLGVVETGHFAD